MNNIYTIRNAQYKSVAVLQPPVRRRVLDIRKAAADRIFPVMFKYAVRVTGVNRKRLLHRIGQSEYFIASLGYPHHSYTPSYFLFNKTNLIKLISGKKSVFYFQKWYNNTIIHIIERSPVKQFCRRTALYNEI
jgi:hypothetical protein